MNSEVDILVQQSRRLASLSYGDQEGIERWNFFSYAICVIINNLSKPYT